MEYQYAHIGKMIEKELRKQGRSVSWFARTINLERSGVYKLFDRPQIDTNNLTLICHVLKHDFFLDISRELHVSIVDSDCYDPVVAKDYPNSQQ